MRRSIILFFVLLLISTLVAGQADKIEYILNSNTGLTNKIEKSRTQNKIFLKTEFASPVILNSSEFKKIKDNAILRIELVYTTYKKSDKFDQKELNRNRLISLRNLAPEILKNEMTEWEMVGQTACSSPEDGNDFFHGFVITYRPASTKETVEKEIEYIRKILSGEDTKAETTEPDRAAYGISSVVEEMPEFKGGNSALSEYLLRTVRYPEEAKEKGIQGTVYISFVINESGEVSLVKAIKGIGGGCDEEAIRVIEQMPKWIPANQRGKPVSSNYTLPVRFFLDGSLPLTESVYLTPVHKGKSSTSDLSSGSLATHDRSLVAHISDSTIFNVFSRNSGWNKMLLVCDFTGSMSPYTVQLLLWFRLYNNTDKQKIEHFTFFNDGDHKPNTRKQIGKTGGIYHSKSRKLEDIIGLAEKTMMRGHGGDVPENNIEALLEAIGKCEDCEEIIMIADNFATPRDMSLLHQVDKPVRIILCGTNGGINTAYLDIVRHTKGSLHTIEDDILNLAEMNEGGEITIGNMLYKIKRGKFIPVYTRKNTKYNK